MQTIYMRSNNTVCSNKKKTNIPGIPAFSLQALSLKKKKSKVVLCHKI